MTLSSLPLELLEQILVHLDNPTLLSLGKVNHLFNYVALQALFTKNDVSGPSDGHLISGLTPPEIIPALHAALWLKKLSSITHFFNPDLERMVCETRGLEALVERLDGVSHVELDFDRVDCWIEELERRKERREGREEEIRPKKERWKKEFGMLLDRILAKGCTTLEIHGARQFHEMYTDESGVIFPLGSSLIQSPTDLPYPKWINNTTSCPKSLSNLLLHKFFYAPPTPLLIKNGWHSSNSCAHSLRTSHLRRQCLDSNLARSIRAHISTLA